MQKFSPYPSNLPLDEKDAYGAFMTRLSKGISIPRKERNAILRDFTQLIAYYHDNGLPVHSAIERIGDGILGDFYAPPPPGAWYPLDSAAKVYPLSMTHTSMSIFRVSAYLSEPIAPAVLQVALLATVKRFPLFATTIRKGFFWHYIDPTRRRFAVAEECSLPCTPINVGGRNAASFRVLYYGHRISVEVFHILTDGTGAMTFLKTLAKEYLRLKGTEIPHGADILDVSEAPKETELRNDFSMGTPVKKGGGFMGKTAAQLRGVRTGYQPARVLHFVMPSDDLLRAAHERNVTVTALLLALMFLACAENLRTPKPSSRISIQVPVNMRKFYPSVTLRNFSMYYVLTMTRSDCGTLEMMLPIVDARLREGTCKKNLDRMMQMTNTLVNNPLLRFTPLFFKQMIMRFGYKVVGERTITTTLSNLGVIKNEFGDAVRMFDFVLGASGTNNANCALVTYAGNSVFTIVRSTKDTGFENFLFEQLAALGIPAAVEEASL